MSMYRQLWLSIIASALIALGASLFASLMNARGYLEQQLSMKNRDNAAALALSLNQDNSTPEDVVLAVTAQYNSGQYEQIQVIDPNGHVLVERMDKGEIHGAPGWFMRLLPIDPAPGQARITSGWTQLGTVTVVSHSHFAYAALWKTARHMTGAIFLSGLLGGILVSLVLGRMRKPMAAVIDQARAITERRFITIPEPDVPELRQLALAMNDTVQRLRQMIEDEANSCDALRRAANYDILTGLANRAFFMANLGEALEAEEGSGGTLAMVRLLDLEGINRRHGRDGADECLRACGVALGQLAEAQPGSLAARLHGADFAWLLPSDQDPVAMLENLQQEFTRVSERFAEHTHGACIAYAQFPPAESLCNLMARVDTALNQAVASGKAGVRKAESSADGPVPRDIEQWRASLRHALLSKGGLKLVHHAIRNTAAGGEQSECPLRLRLEDAGEWLPASRFLPYAERLGLVQELDLAAVGMALEELTAHPEIGGLWVNISARSVGHEGFRQQLLEKLQEVPEACSRLWLEVPESGALRRIEALRSLVAELKPLGCHVGLEHYGHQFNQIGLLYDLGLDFLKVDASFVRGIDGNAGNQAFLSGLCDIAHKIGIRVFAEGVENEAELRKLEDLGFDGVTGVAVAG